MKKFGFGAMRLPLLDKKDPESIDKKQLDSMVDIFMQSGFTYFDTAYVYHNHRSEEALRKSLVERYPRNSFTVATKLPAGEVKSLEDRDIIFNNQLKNLGVEYIDYYLLHCVMHTNLEPTFEKYDCFNWLAEKKAAGLVKHAGFSFHDSAELLDQMLTKYPWVDFVQLQINYLDWESYDIQSKKCYEVCKKHGKPVIVMEPVKGGALANVSDKVADLFKSCDPSKSIASWGIRFAASLDNVFMVLSGMSDISQVEDNTNIMKDFQPLTEAEWNTCLKAAEIIDSERAIKCTGCSYCTAGCPQEIKIPELFKMYNRLKQATSEGTIGRLHIQFDEFVKDNTRPSECVECGQCEDACPQHLSIRDYLKDVAKDFE